MSSIIYSSLWSIQRSFSRKLILGNFSRRNSKALSYKYDRCVVTVYGGDATRRRRNGSLRWCLSSLVFVRSDQASKTLENFISLSIFKRIQTIHLGK